MDLDDQELEATKKMREKKCEYCSKKINKKINDVDNDEEDEARVVFLDASYLKVELNGEDADGYKTSDFFEINYCPMCGRKLV